jgi:hypothetical protein
MFWPKDPPERDEVELQCDGPKGCGRTWIAFGVYHPGGSLEHDDPEFIPDEPEDATSCEYCGNEDISLVGPA